jgi:hypothetical protein
MRVLVQFSACCALGLVVALLLLLGLMFCGQFSLIDGLLFTGKPLAQLGLQLLPEAFWGELSGLPNATQNSTLQSFLALCAALGQVGLLLAAGFFRLWYWR